MKRTQSRVALLTLVILTTSSLRLASQRQQSREPNSASLSGTFELESSRSDDPQLAAEAATRSLPPAERERTYQSLLSRFDAPQTLSIDRDGRTITIASSRGPRTVFVADGQTRSERGLDGRTVKTRSEISGNRLTVSADGGSRGSDFSVTFEAMENGAGIRVSKRLDDDDLRRPVTIQSYYRRIERAARWDVYDSGRGYGQEYGTRPWSDVGDMRVPSGTRFAATLDTPLSMRASRDGEPFTMTVRSPAEFQGARIDGVISRAYASESNRSTQDIRIDFWRLELGGRSFDFDAYLNTVRLPDGTLLRVNEDGNVPEVARRDTTLQNGAIGAAIGAIIGSVAAGGTGAAVGALVGGTGGVIASQGHEQLDLRAGSEVTLTAVTRNGRP